MWPTYQITAGWVNTCGIQRTGTLWCWGRNAEGQLGQGDVTYRSTPTQVGAATTWASVTGMTYATCAIRTERSAWCWGANGGGQLGLGDTTNRSAPVQLTGVTALAWVVQSSSAEHQLLLPWPS